MNDLKNLGLELKKMGLSNEKFELSILISKLAAEQLELIPPEDIKYNCSICGYPHETSDISFYSADDLASRAVTPKYVLPGTKLYPVCLDCEEDQMILPCALCDEPLEEGDSTLVTEDLLDEADGFKTYDLPRGELYPVCHDCYSEELTEYCADCYDADEKGTFEHYNPNNDKICESCSFKYTPCSECSELISMEYGEYHSTDHGVYCFDCGVPNSNDIEALSAGLTKSFNESDYRPKDLLPLSSVTISKTINLLANIYKKNQAKEFASPKASRNFMATLMNQKIPEEDKIFLKNFLTKSLSFRELERYRSKNQIDISSLESRRGVVSWLMSFGVNMGQAETLLRLFEEGDMRLFDKSIPLETISPLSIESIKKILDYDSYKKEFMNEFSKEFAPIKDAKVTKGYYPLDVVFEVQGPRDSGKDSSFVIVMNPSERMLDYSDFIFGKAGREAWKMMSSMGTYHFHGAIAYARIGNNDGEWVIDNLQRDSDLSNFKRSESRIENDPMREEIKNAAKWWDKQLKHWASHMLLVIRDFAKESGSELYLTTYDIQTDKWSSLPEKNRDIYDKIPEELRKMRQKAREVNESGKDVDDVLPKLVTYDGEVEDTSGRFNDLWRLANRIRRLVKLAKIQR
jgi:hypothetical protein